MKDTKVLFVKRGSTRFEDQDLNILSRHFHVTEYQPNSKNITSVFSKVRKHDIIFFWFPNDYKFLIALIGKLFGKKVIVVGGGQMSTADNKEGRKRAGVKYRLMFRLLGIWAVKLSDKLIAVSKYEVEGLSRYRQKEKIRLLYNNYNTDLFHPYPEKKDPKLIVTVSAIDEIYFIRKGLDIFIDLASKNPDFNFVLIGKFNDMNTVQKIKDRNIPNLTLTGFVSDEELISWLKKASVYCQFSKQEGFGVALAEAQACNCIPFVSRFGAIPEVAGPDAFYIEENHNWEDLRLVLQKCEQMPEEERSKFSSRIIEKFGSVNREQDLINIVESIV